MVIQLNEEECEKLKCDVCGTPLCEELPEGDYQILGHYNMGDGIRCVPCYEINDRPLKEEQ